jgi:hypothetical protein
MFLALRFCLFPSVSDTEVVYPTYGHNNVPVLPLLTLPEKDMPDKEERKSVALSNV